jgi:hypothetical protein
MAFFALPGRISLHADFTGLGMQLEEDRDQPTETMARRLDYHVPEPCSGQRGSASSADPCNALFAAPDSSGGVVGIRE